MTTRTPRAGKGFEINAGSGHTLFLPAFIDDYGFTAEEFRVFSRIMRRSLGSAQDCFESVPSLAKTLMISERLIKRALKVLEKCGAIIRTERSGKSDIFDFNSCEKWKPRAQLEAIRAEIDFEIKRKDRQRKQPKNFLVGAETHRVTGCGNAPGEGAETPGVLGAETHPEGISHKGNPIKEKTTDADASLASSSPPAESVSPPGDSPTESTDETFWDVWVGIEKKQGVLESTARKRLGSLIKQFGAELVAGAINQSLSTKADAFAYLKGTLSGLRNQAELQKAEDEVWLGEQKYVKDTITRQMVDNPHRGDPRFLPNFPHPALIPEWYQATAAKLQARQGVTNAA